jgi:acyl-CoA thioesterase
MIGIDPSVQRLLASDASSAAFGIDVLSAADGVAVARATVTERWANGHGIGHGGFVYSLADTAFACAAGSVFPDTATASASIVYFTPALVGDELIAEAAVRHRAGRQCLVDVTVRCGDRVVAEYRGRGVVLSKGKERS